MSKTKKMLKAAQKFHGPKTSFDFHRAIHESGHTLIAHLFNLNYIHVTINRDKMVSQEDIFGRVEDTAAGGLGLDISPLSKEFDCQKRSFFMLGFFSTILGGGFATKQIENSLEGIKCDIEMLDDYYSHYKRECIQNDVAAFSEEMIKTISYDLTKKFKNQIIRLAKVLKVKGFLDKSEVEEILYDVPVLTNLNMFQDFIKSSII